MLLYGILFESVNGFESHGLPFNPATNGSFDQAAREAVTMSGFAFIEVIAI